MSSKSNKTLLTSSILILAILQGPFTYYYGSGPLVIFLLPLYMFVGFALTLIALLSFKRHESTIYHFIGLVAGPIIGIASVFSSNIIEKLDWKLRFSERNHIVQLVKEGKLKSNVSYNNSTCKLPGNYILPISTGGNEIIIYKGQANTVNVEFFIFRGLLDNYSAFLYTNEEEEISRLDRAIRTDGNKNFVKLAPNWYRVSY